VDDFNEPIAPPAQASVTFHMNNEPGRVCIANVTSAANGTAQGGHSNSTFNGTNLTTFGPVTPSAIGTFRSPDGSPLNLDRTLAITTLCAPVALAVEDVNTSGQHYDVLVMQNGQTVQTLHGQSAPYFVITTLEVGTWDLRAVAVDANHQPRSPFSFDSVTVTVPARCALPKPSNSLPGLELEGALAAAGVAAVVAVWARRKGDLP
jgi:hypothetical protein